MSDPAFGDRQYLLIPPPALLALPERVLQFGTGSFLRAFADYFIDAANRSGQYDGRVVMVGTTPSGRSETLGEQGGLYTLRVQGLQDGRPVETFTVVSSISRALSASEHWVDVLACAHNPALDLVISNTTEVGIVFDPDDRPGPMAPRSFPGKLTAFLYERGRAFDFDRDRGLVVLPCELIEQNGATLKAIVLQLAERWGLGTSFADWVERAVPFCNTLVDRIAPGIPRGAAHGEVEARLGYRDAMLTSAEVYRLWAIEAPAEARPRLRFAAADPGVVLTDDITPFRERKVRILNGGHTVSVPAAFLAGFSTVVEMMDDPVVRGFVHDVMMEEIVPSLDVDGGDAFARDVIDRFSNPYLRHQLIDITFQSTSKWRMRLVPSLQRYYEKRGALPRRICFGFAAYLLFMRATGERDGTRYGTRNGSDYPINDAQAGYFHALWQDAGDLEALVRRVAGHDAFWGMDLNQFAGFSETVAGFLVKIEEVGPRAVMESLA
ncbi:MAG: tagaturonate reductase [Rhodothermales bacterium]